MRLNPNLPSDPALDPLEEVMRAALAERGQALPTGLPPAEDPLAAAFSVPEGPDRYAIEVPRGIDRDAAFETRARGWFHEAGLPQNLVNGIVREYCRCLAQPDAGRDEGRAMTELARDWGSDCARKIELARAVIGRCGDAPAIEAVLAESGLGNNPWLIRSLAAFAELPGAMRGTGGRPA
jgi:hypothetical protein